jgi:hydroxymethylbilane synthase
MKRIIRVGSRQSRLAVIQANMVIDTIRRHHPALEFELITMKTSGDVILDRNLDEVGGKGLFVKELDIGLREGRIDFAVHSLKDMPMLTPEDLPIVSLTKRENPFDALVLPAGVDGAEIDLSKPFGCSSARRKLQLSMLYPGAAVKGIRGNVQLRLQKVDSGDYAATVLACAGLNRLGLQARISKVFGEDDMIPAAGQGILAVQAREGEDHTYLLCTNDEASQVASLAERAFVTRLDGGCSSPIAAYAKISGSRVVLHGLHFDENSGRHVIGRMDAPVSDTEQLGVALAEQLLEKVKAPERSFQI